MRILYYNRTNTWGLALFEQFDNFFFFGSRQFDNINSTVRSPILNFGPTFKEQGPAV